MADFIRVTLKSTGTEALIAKDRILYVDEVKNGGVYINFTTEDNVEVDHTLKTMETLLNG